MTDDLDIYDAIVQASLRPDHWPLDDTTPVLPPVQDDVELSQGQVDAEIDQFLSDHPAEPTTKRRRKT